MDLSSTSPFSQHRGWTGHTLPLGLSAHNVTSANDQLSHVCFKTVFVFNSYSRQLVEGIDVLRIVEEIATFNERPTFECRVAGCGALEFKGPEIHTYSACEI